MAVCLFIWWPLSWLFNTPALGSYFKTYFLDYVGLFDKVSGNLVYWMLLLLIPVAVLMPQLFIAGRVTRLIWLQGGGGARASPAIPLLFVPTPTRFAKY